MSDIFNVIFLGNFADLDPIEGNEIGENVQSLVGETFGGVGDALSARIQELSPGTVNFSGGQDAEAYESDNDNANESFRIDGGMDQFFDSAFAYNATITYLNGTTAQITAVLFQDATGGLYLAPEISQNLDQDALDAEPILSLTLNSVDIDVASGLNASRSVGFVPCLNAGTRIKVGNGDRVIEELKVGDLVMTRDDGLMPIRWIGSKITRCHHGAVPIRIKKGALGEGTPSRDLVVSQQHRMLIRSKVAMRMFGVQEVLIAAKKLFEIDGVSLAEDLAEVEYFHILLDHHAILIANDAETESLLCGSQAEQALGAESVLDIRVACPDLVFGKVEPARYVPTGRECRELIERCLRNRKPLVEHVERCTSPQFETYNTVV